MLEDAVASLLANTRPVEILAREFFGLMRVFAAIIAMAIPSEEELTKLLSQVDRLRLALSSGIVFRRRHGSLGLLGRLLQLLSLI